MNGTKKNVKTLERSIFEIDPGSGQKIILPLDLEAIRKEINAGTSQKQGQSQRRKSHLNGPNSGRKKKESKDVEEEFKMFDSVPVSSQPFLRPLDLEAIRNDLKSSNSTKKNPQQKRKSNLNGPIINGKHKESNDVEEKCKTFEIDPVTGHRMLPRLDLEAIRKAVNNEGIRHQNVKQINSGMKRILSKESQDPYKMFEIDEKPAKLRKKETTHCVRKGLFSSKLDRNSKKQEPYGRQNILKKEPKIISPKSSPLLNMEEVEDELINKKGFLKLNPFKSPQHCITKCTEIKHSTSKTKTLNIPEMIMEESETIPENIVEDIVEEPKTPDTSDEFNKLEEMCLEKDLESPITSISNLMQVTGINSSIKRTKLNFNTNSDLKMAVNDIKQLIKDEEVRHTRLMEEEETRHKQNLLKLNSLLTNLTNLVEVESENKENTPEKSTRRSIRLQNKSPLKDSNGKVLFTSPSFSRSGDLRKNTLKKNLVAKHLDYQSPRSKKAMELYNAMRSINPILETPKTDRKGSAETPTSMSTRQMSMKLHNQCLLLQDTPIPK